MTQPKINFYRGTLGTLLPNIEEGAIFVLQGPQLRDGSALFEGEIYVDVDSTHRVRIASDSSVIVGTKEELQGTVGNFKVGEEGVIYYITDFEQDTSQTPAKDIPAIKIGTGAYLVDSPAINLDIQQQLDTLKQKQVIYDMKIDNTNKEKLIFYKASLFSIPSVSSSSESNSNNNE